MKTIIFDFDGTIADSLDIILDIVYQLTKNPKLKDPKEVERLRRRSLISIATDIKLPKYKWPYLFFKGRYVMNKYVSQIQLYPGVESLIEGLYKSGYKLYILSSNKEKNIEKFLLSNGLNKYFPKIYNGLGVWGKARTLKKILRQNNLQPVEAIYVANEPDDIEAARASGIECIAVSWGFHDPKILTSHRPFALAEKPEDILKAIKKWDV